jgi:hypothetical protein
MHPLVEAFYTLTGILIIFFIYCRIVDIFKLKKDVEELKNEIQNIKENNTKITYQYNDNK